MLLVDAKDTQLPGLTHLPSQKRLDALYQPPDGLHAYYLSEKIGSTVDTKSTAHTEIFRFERNISTNSANSGRTPQRVWNMSFSYTCSAVNEQNEDETIFSNLNFAAN